MRYKAQSIIASAAQSRPQRRQYGVWQGIAAVTDNFVPGGEIYVVMKLYYPLSQRHLRTSLFS